MIDCGIATDSQHYTLITAKLCKCEIFPYLQGDIIYTMQSVCCTRDHSSAVKITDNSADYNMNKELGSLGPMATKHTQASVLYTLGKGTCVMTQYLWGRGWELGLINFRNHNKILCLVEKLLSPVMVWELFCGKFAWYTILLTINQATNFYLHQV